QAIHHRHLNIHQHEIIISLLKNIQGLPAIVSQVRTPPPRLLLVEDNAFNQQVALRVLRKFGLSADLADNGREALNILEKTDYDLVLMDVQMPVMDGLKAAEIIRDPGSAVRNHDIPIIAMTAHVMKGDRERCIYAGMNDYLSKPLEPEKLLSAIRGQIENRDLKIENRKSAPPAHQLSSFASSVFDWEEFADRLGDDEEVCKVMLKQFAEYLPGRIGNLKESLDKDAEMARIQAHGIKGMAANMSAPGLRDAAYEVESAVKKGETEKARSLINRLEEECERFLSALTDAGLLS
ncbi:response regulator, partial [Desulfobacterales bacterium HSG2]|nr:response regulator [Desulfobacterales bacterium HSG2]